MAMNDVRPNQALPEFFLLTQLIGNRVVTAGGTGLGKLTDLEVRFSGRYPEVVNLVVGRSFGRPPLAIPFSLVSTLDPGKIRLEVSSEQGLAEFDRSPERVLIREMILDKRIIDTDEFEIEVVYDIHLLQNERRMFVVHVDVSRAGMLRRLHLGWLARLIYGRTKELRLLPWKYVQPLPSDIDRFKGDVKLNVSRDKIADIHPADLADILEELNGEERMAVFNTLDTETAADALEETEPRVQRQLVAAMRRERVVELLNTMTPAQISDILEILPRGEAEAFRATLPPDMKTKVGELLDQHEVKLDSLATNRYLALDENATVADALARLRDRSKRYDVVMYVYVVSGEGVLRGVVDIRDLIQADPSEKLGSTMVQQVVMLSARDTTTEAIQEFNQYGFAALPMVDQAGRITGVVRQKDLRAVVE